MFYKDGNIDIHIEKVLTKFVDICPFVVFTVMELETSIKNLLIGLTQKSKSHSKGLCPWQCLKELFGVRKAVEVW